MISRKLKYKAQQLLEKYPILTITGPRQSGKTTLIKELSDSLPYVNLEQPDIRKIAETDPKALINQYSKGAIFDEIQYVPELFSYLQVVSDENPNSKFILSGSHNFLQMERITQSLAGRTAILKLLPFSVSEIKEGYNKKFDLWELIYNGFYPRIYDRSIAPEDFYPFYIQTYIERDVRQIINVGDLSRFITFLKICAGRTGQLINYSSIANDVGISPNTVKNWLSVLEASYILIQLQPHHKNFNKRLTKQSKLYFFDTGLACNLLQIKSREEIKTHYLKGGLFENFIITELIKKSYNKGQQHHLYFRRDHKGKEIDCIKEDGQSLIPIEIKAGETISQNYFSNITYWNKLSENSSNNSYVIYGGDQSIKLESGNLLSWKNLSELNF